MPARRASRVIASALLYALPGLALTAVVAIAFGKVIFLAPEFDEVEVLHASWLIAHVGRIWVDVFEHHSPLFNVLNARIFDTDSLFLVIHAKLLAFAVYLAGTCLFAIACQLWLDVQRGVRRSFILYAALFYVVLTWPTALGIVRPENYSMFALMAGSVFGLLAVRAASGQSCVLAFASGALLAIAVSFSPRTIILAGAAALLIGHSLRQRPDWLRIFAAAFFGGVLACAINLAIAPLSGFYLWMVDFISRFRPYRREFPYAALGAMIAAAISIAISAACLVARSARAVGTGAWRSKVASIVALPAYRRLLGPQVVLIVCWLYLFADHHWGSQSYGGIAVAASAYVAAVIALVFELVATAGNAQGGDAATGTEALVDRMVSSVVRAWARPRLRPVAVIAAAAVIACVAALAYLSIDKISRIASRWQITGMMADLSLVRTETSYVLPSGNELLPLSETRSLAEWLLWSKRECALFRNERVLFVPTRHPICAHDASYYWYSGEHFRAMAQDGVGFVPNPPYRVVDDILATRPVIIDADTVNGPLGNSDVAIPAVAAMLRNEYRLIQSDRLGQWAWLRKDFPPAR